MEMCSTGRQANGRFGNGILSPMSDPRIAEAAIAAGPNRERHDAAQRCTLVSVAVNTALALLQITVGWFGRSQALLADGIHTFSDLLSDFLVLFANRHGSKEADEDHPYGHQRIETAATLILGGSLVIVGLSILWNAGVRLTSGQAFVTVHWVTLVIALVTLASKETLYHYLMGVARKYRSQILAANAWHTRADAATSLVGAVGIAGNLMGFTFLDSLAAALVAFMIVRMGWKLGFDALSELVDTALSEEEVAEIRSTLLATPGVRGLHELRTRKMAHQALVDAHVMVDPRISVSEGHFIAESARRAVLKKHSVLEVLVHIDPEDDFTAKPSAHLPGRDALLRELSDGFGDDMPPPQQIVLHYLDGQVEADAYLNENALEDAARAESLRRRLNDFVSNSANFRAVRLHNLVHRSGA